MVDLEEILSTEFWRRRFPRWTVARLVSSIGFALIMLAAVIFLLGLVATLMAATEALIVIAIAVGAVGCTIALAGRWICPWTWGE